MVGGGMNFGAFYVNLGGNYGQNYEEYGAGGPSLAGVRAIDDQSGLFSGTDEERDNETYGFPGRARFQRVRHLDFRSWLLATSNAELDVAGDSDGEKPYGRHT
jgi:hypothetical protein